MKKYVFAYGSLVNKYSRSKTLHEIDKSTIYGYIEGYARAWCLNIEKHKTTALGILKSNKATCNGVFIEVSDNDLEKLDGREIGGSKGKYKRIELSKNICSISFDKDCVLYTYLALCNEYPSENYPILLSYLQVVSSGFYYYGKQPLKDFFTSTENWNDNFLNDSLSPKYPHPKKISFSKPNIKNLLREAIAH